MGDIWTPLDPQKKEIIIWQHPFPLETQDQAVSEQNLHGHLNNLELELIGIIAHDCILLEALGAPSQTTMAGCDNIAAISWIQKGAITTQGPITPLLHF